MILRRLVEFALENGFSCDLHTTEEFKELNKALKSINMDDLAIYGED